MFKIIILVALLMLSACASQSTLQPARFSAEPAPADIGEKAQKKSIVIFFDGTANQEASRTNVSKLHNLVSLQNRPDIHSIYIQGVGTSGLTPTKLLGMAFGFRIGEDVREAYKFVSERYNRNNGDKIYVFGFSRGAYAARIFAGMLEIAGAANLTGMEDKARDKLIKRVYSAHKGKLEKKQRQTRVRNVDELVSRPVEIEFMGLWDTVAALGLPDFSENFATTGRFSRKLGRLEKKYVDQLCNINRAAHALSLDDNRARSFTPTLLTLPELVADCAKKSTINIHTLVDEVWFAGAHSDVGGGYPDTEIDGVSLNWMLGKIRQYKLVPADTQVLEDPNGKVHKPGSGWGLGWLYRNQNRHIQGYLSAAEYPDKKLPIHASVIERLTSPNGAGKPAIGYNWLSKINTHLWKHCFNPPRGKQDYPNCDGKACKLALAEKQNCFRVEETVYATSGSKTKPQSQ